MSIKTIKSRDATNEERNQIIQDHGWAWIVLGGAFISVVMTQIPLVCFGILYRPILSRFNASSTAISWLFTLHSFVWNIFSIMLAPLCDAFGWRKVAISGAICNSASLLLSGFVNSFETLFIVFSLLGAIGGSIGVGTSFIVVSNYFKNRRGFAMAVTTLGVCVALFLGPPSAVYLQKEYTSIGAFLILGAILLHNIPGSMLFRPNTKCHKQIKHLRCNSTGHCKKITNGLPLNKSDITLLLKTSSIYHSININENSDNSSNLKPNLGSMIRSVFYKTLNNFWYLKHKRIVVICVATPFLYLGYVNFQMWIPFALIDYGFSIEMASLTMSAAGVTNAIGRICTCALADWSKINNISLYNTGVLLIALSILMFASFQSVTTLISAICIWGFSVGIAMALYPVVIIEVVGVKYFPIAYGLASLFAGIELLLFGPIIGLVKDSSPTFQIPLTLMSVLVLITFVAWLFMPMAQRYDKEKQEETSENSTAV